MPTLFSLNGHFNCLDIRKHGVAILENQDLLEVKHMGVTNPYQAWEFYRYLGEALWHLQIFDEALAHYSCLVIEELEIENKLSRTILIERLVANKKIPKSLCELAKGIVEERKWLCHSVHKETDLDFNGGKKIPRIIGRISALIQAILEAQQEVKNLINIIGKGETLSAKQSEKKEALLSSLENE